MSDQTNDKPLDDFADEFLRHDPCRAMVPEFDPVTRQGRQQWKGLSSQRRRRLRRRRFVIVTTVAAVLCLSAINVAKYSELSAPRIARTDSQKQAKVKDSLIESMKSPQPSDPPKPSPRWFRDQLQKAGPHKDPSWHAVTVELAKQSVATQRLIISWIAFIDSEAEQIQAMELVGDVAGSDERNLIAYWLQQDSTRSAALTRALVLAQPDELLVLSSFAKSESEKVLLCETAWQSSDLAAADALVKLSAMPQWRTAVRLSALPVTDDWIMPLLMQLRQRDWEARTATAFVLASIPGKHFDEVATKMVVQGRYRQPAYLALMSRNTPAAKAFLAGAANKTELAAGLYSARAHFAVMEAKLIQWKKNSQGDNQDVPLQNSRIKAGGSLRSYAIDLHPGNVAIRIAKHRG